jgi:hypothetical protein
MATIFSAPTIGDPRATGVKNGGIKAFESDIVYPVSRLVDSQFTPGKQLEFRWRSDSNRFWSPRDTKLYVKYQLQFGAPHGAVDGNADITTAADDVLNFDATTLDNSKAQLARIKNVRMTAAPNTCLFDGGMRYLQNSVVVENQTEPYTACMAQLVTKTDLAGTDTGMAGTLSLRKDVGADTAFSTAESVNAARKPDATNPKQELISLGCSGDKSTFEIAEPVFLASWQHGYACGPNDYQLFMTISNDFAKDILHCPLTAVGTRPDYTEVVYGTPPAAGNQGKIYLQIKSVELHVAYVSPAQPFIPPSQSLRFSQFQVTTRVLRSTNVNESIIVPPGVRQILVGLRQNHHGLNFDREELSKCGAEINEKIDTANGNLVNQTDTPANRIYWWETFQCQLGSAIAPTVAFSQLDVKNGQMARPYNEFLSVIGKPLGMRGNTMTFAQYIGKHNSNLGQYLGSADTKRSGNYGDMGPLIALRLLTPDSTLSNNLQIRGTLTTTGGGSGPDQSTQQEMVVIVVADSMLDVQYAPPAEIPIKTSVNALV